MIRKYCMKYLLVVCAFFAVGYSWADPRDDISDRTKPVWNDYTLNLFQYFIEVLQEQVMRIKTILVLY